MKTRIFAVGGVCLFICLASFAQNTDPAFVKERLNTVVQSYAVHNVFMGAVLVADGDKVLLDKGYGMANLEWNIPNTPDVEFRLCSLSKQFTAALVLLLQQDGKLKLEDPVKQYLPDTPKSWEKISLAHLLGHTSGIPDIVSDKTFGPWSMSSHVPAEQLAFLSDKPLDFELGSQFAYSNSNYLVLGMVIEKVSGQSYGDALRQRILLPLGLKETGLDTDELVLPKRAQGYQTGANGLLSARSMSMTVPWAAGSIYSTTGDMLRWERGLFGRKLLNGDSLLAMTTAGKGNYGLGVEVGAVDGSKLVRHGGALQGFNTQMIYMPDKGIAVILLSNVSGTITATMGEQLLDVALGKPVILAGERKAVPIARDELAQFTGIYDVAPSFAITITAGGDSLMAQGSGQQHALSLMYQGATGGRALFYVPQIDAELEFVPDSTGAITSLVLHQGEGDHPAKKR